MRVLLLGASGMLGSALFRALSAVPGLAVCATARSDTIRRHFTVAQQKNLATGIDARDTEALLALISGLRPDVILNCVGVVKQVNAAHDPLVILPVNALLPHRLARLAGLVGARLVHVSTDCVFSGSKGNYTETAVPDAQDLYGRSKLLGEVDEPHAITLRTSIIGREIETRHGLVEWFLAAASPVRGFTRAIFSGLTTDELARVIVRYVLPNPAMSGVWHVGAEPISKHDLLVLLRAAYGRDTTIQPDPSVEIDRSLDSSRFRTATGYRPPRWPDLIAGMRALEVTP